MHNHVMSTNKRQVQVLEQRVGEGKQLDTLQLQKAAVSINGCRGFPKMGYRFEVLIIRTLAFWILY